MSQTEYLNVVDMNPLLFLQQVQEAILNGFRVDNTIVTYPALHGVMKEILLNRSDLCKDTAPIHPVDETADEVVVSEYESMSFMLDFQDAVLKGFRLVEDGFYFDSLKQVTLAKPKEAVVEEEKPKRGRKAKDKGEE